MMKYNKQKGDKSMIYYKIKIGNIVTICVATKHNGNTIIIKERKNLKNS